MCDGFSLYDNEDNNSTIIILFSYNDLNRLSNAEHWHADATFKVKKHRFILTMTTIF